MHMHIFKESFELKSGLTVDIKRIQPEKSNFKKYKLIPIKNSAFWAVSMAFNYDDKYVFLPQLYTALTYLTGDSDNWYDDYKGSYSFTFELNVKKDNLDSQYIYHVYHYRSYIEFSVYQKVSKEDTRDMSIFHAPNDLLFSDEDISYFSKFFCGYLLGYIEGSGYMPEPFLKHSDSNLLLFGYAESKYFIKQYEDDTEYYNEKNGLSI